MMISIAVETPFSVPSPSPSIAQSDATVPTVIEAPPNQNITIDPIPNFRSELSDPIMRQSNGSAGTNSMSSPNDRAITSSHLTVTSPPPLQLQSTLNNLSSLTPEQISLLLSFLSQLDVPSSPSIDPSLGLPSNDNADVNQLNTFAHSPSNFDFSSLGNLSSPGFASSLGTGTGLPPLLTGTPAAETASTPTSPGMAMGPEHLLTLEPDAANAAAVLPRLERHWKGVQDMDKDVLESENQIHQLIDSLGPFLLSGAGLSGLGLAPAVQMNNSSTMMPSMNEATPTMKPVNMPNAASSTLATTKMDGRNNDVDDVDTDISSLDPTHLSIPTGLENTDFDFDSFFPHNSSTSSSDPATMTSAADASPLAIPLSIKPSVIDATRDINFDMDGISGIGDINGYNDLNVGPQTRSSSFLNNEHSPPPPPPPPESPVQRTTKTKTSSTPTTTTTGPNTSGIGRKRKSEVIGMEELEDALLGVAKDGSARVVSGGETVSVKAKRRKDERGMVV